MSKPTAEDMLGSSACRAQRRLNTALDALVKLLANYKRDFGIALTVAAIASLVVVALARYEFPRLAFGVSIVGAMLVCEHMHRVWRESKQSHLRVASAVVMLVVGTFSFAVGAWWIHASPLQPGF